MDQHMYINITLHYAENIPVVWKFQHDNDPKYAARSVTHWFGRNVITILNWPLFSPDLNSIKHLRKDVKWSIRQKKISNMDKEVVIAWQATSQECCAALVEFMGRRCEAM